MSEVDKFIRKIESVDDLIDHDTKLEDIDEEDSEDIYDDEIDDDADFERRWYG